VTTQENAEPTDGDNAAQSDYISDRKFADFPLSPEVLQGITELGYTDATPVQAATIEVGIAGKDMLVRAKTGTGKTAAFCVPVVERVVKGNRFPQAVILAPTRELAQQIAEECSGIAKFLDISVTTLVGGLPMGPQEKALKDGTEIIVGTPGRVLDHLRRKNLDLSQATMAVLDEADEMLSMGFYMDVTGILDNTAADRQVLLFSATISNDTEKLVRKYLNEDAENIRLSTDADNVDLIEHILYETTPEMHKIRALLYVIDIENPVSAIIFCNTREDTATVASFLDRQGLDVQLLSGELSQARRSQVMKKVKSGEVRFLVATDVAARGIDISDLSHVLNYSLPQDASVYLHRTGRTGRIGKKGTAINLVGGADMGTRKTLENVHKMDFTIRELPSAEEAVRKRVDRQSEQIRAAMGKMVFESYLPTVRELKERPGGDALLAAALRAFFQWEREQRAAASGVDSIADLITARNEKLARKNARNSGRERGRGRGSDRRDSKPRRPAKTEDLDALLSGSDDAAPAKKNKRKRKRNKKSSDSSPAPAPAAQFEDLDALLSSE
jgi:ATP-dependent RNA helicase DeaD